MINTLANLPKDYISISQLNCYNECSHKYLLKYVEKRTISNLTKIDGLLLGSAFHKFIESYYADMPDKEDHEKHFFTALFDNISQGRVEIVDQTAKDLLRTRYRDYQINGIKKYDEIIDELEKVLTLENYQTFIVGYIETLKTGDKERPSLLRIYNNLVKYFIENKENFLKDVILKEQESDFDYIFERYGKEFNITGILDYVGIYNDKPIIIDWKTSKRAWSENDVMRKQDIIYSYLYWKIKGVIPLFRYVVFSYSDKTGDVKNQVFDIQYSEKQLIEVEKMIHSIARGINEKVFFKNEGSWMCSADYCEYYKECQRYKEGVLISEIK